MNKAASVRATSTTTVRPAASVLRIVLVAMLAAAIDMTASMIYWQMNGGSPASVLRAIAGWVLGPPRPPATGFVFAVGLLLHYAVYLAMAAVFSRVLARLEGHLKHRTLTGFTYGVMTYITVYLVLVPALVFPQQLTRSPEWITVCVLMHGVILGPLMAWLLGSPVFSGRKSISSSDFAVH